MKIYMRIEKIVEAEPMTAFDFLLLNPKHRVDGGRPNDYRAGFKVVDGESESWVSQEEFEKEFVEVTGQ